MDVILCDHLQIIKNWICYFIFCDLANYIDQEANDQFKCSASCIHEEGMTFFFFFWKMECIELVYARDD